MDYLTEKPYIKLLPEGPGNMRIVSHEEERAYLDQADSLLVDVATIIVETGSRTRARYSSTLLGVACFFIPLQQQDHSLKCTVRVPVGHATARLAAG
jgi:hypothetical protein